MSAGETEKVKEKGGNVILHSPPNRLIFVSLSYRRLSSLSSFLINWNQMYKYIMVKKHTPPACKISTHIYSVASQRDSVTIEKWVDI